MTQSFGQRFGIGSRCRWIAARCRMSLRTTLIFVTVLVALVALYAMYVNVIAVGNAVVELEEEYNCYVCYESNNRLSPQQRFLTNWFGRPYGTPVTGLVVRDRVNVPLAEKIGKLKSLRHLVIFDNELSDAELMAIGGLPGIRTLYLQSYELEGWGLRNLCSGRHMEKLTLVAPKVTSSAQRPLPFDRIKKLRFHWLSQSSDEFFARLQAAKNLEELTFEINSPTDAINWMQFPDLPQLKRLEVRYCNLETSELRFLAHTPNLEHLRLKASFVVPQSVFRIGVCRQLKSLHLNRHPRLMSVDMFWLKQMEQLEHLDLSETWVDSIILEIISDMPRLRKLDLSSTGCTERGYWNIRGSESLEELTLANCTVGGRVGAILKSFPNLRRLDLTNCSLGDEDLKSWPEHLRLQELSLSGNKSLTTRGLEMLPNLPELKVLDINCTSISGDLKALDRYLKLESLSMVMPFESIDWRSSTSHMTARERDLMLKLGLDENASRDGVKLPELPELRRVRLDHHRIDRRSWESLAKLPKLEQLSLRHCGFELVELKGKLPPLPEVVLLDIGHGQFSLSEFPIFDTVPKMRSLNMGSCRNISLDDVLFLRNLEHVTISDTHVTDTKASLLKLQQLSRLKSMDFDVFFSNPSDPPLYRIFPLYRDFNRRLNVEGNGWDGE